MIYPLHHQNAQNGQNNKSKSLQYFTNQGLLFNSSLHLSCNRLSPSKLILHIRSMVHIVNHTPEMALLKPKLIYQSPIFALNTILFH